MSVPGKYSFEGIAKWCKHDKPDPKYGRYSVDLYLDADSLKKFVDSGLQLQVREDEDGKFVKFARVHKKLVKDDLVTFGPPKVYDADGNEWKQGVNIGNGSHLRVQVSVFPTIKGNGHRLEAIKVLTHVPYGDQHVDTF